MTDSVLCPICGDKKEKHDTVVCYGCYLVSLLPPGYEGREEYEFDPVWKHDNATAKPPTGVGILDQSSGPRLSDSIQISKGRLRF